MSSNPSASARSPTINTTAPSMGLVGCPSDLGHGLEATARRRLTWAELMKRVFALDVLECPICCGPMKIIAEITQPSVIRRFLAALELPSEPPEVVPARPPPQIEFDWADGADVGHVAVDDTRLHHV